MNITEILNVFFNILYTEHLLKVIQDVNIKHGPV